MRNVNIYLDLSSSDTGITVEDINTKEIFVTNIKVSEFKKEHDKNNRAILKIKDLCDKLDYLLRDYVICSVFIESPFLQKKFLGSSEMVLKCHGAILYKYSNLHFSFLTPSEIKKSIASKGNASKEDVIAAIKNLGYNLDIDGKSNDNMYDSFAIYLAFYLQNNPTKKLKDLNNLNVKVGNFK